MPGSAPFAVTRGEDVGDAYYSDHGLREMYARENTERRRAGGHTLRKYLTGAQDRKLTSQFTKIRAEWDVSNNNDVVTVFAQLLIAEGNEAELDPKLVAIAKETAVPRRPTPPATAEFSAVTPKAST